MVFIRIQNFVQLLTIFCLFNIILAFYDPSKIHQSPLVANHQRSADSGYKYAWFTREIHDDGDWNSNEEHAWAEPAQRLLRLKLLKNIFHQKYPNNDPSYSE